jgi:DNA-binding MarR family transcriptional regulator
MYAYDFGMPKKPTSKTSRPKAARIPPPEVQVEPATRVLRRFRSVFNAVKTHFQQVEKKAGVGGAQLWALSLIQAHPGISVGALASTMDIHQTTASNLVKALALAELVTASRDGADRRATQLRVTPAGAGVLRKAPGPFSGVLPEALAALDNETLERLDNDLGKLLDLLQTDERAAGIPLAQM